MVAGAVVDGGAVVVTVDGMVAGAGLMAGT